MMAKTGLIGLIAFLIGLMALVYTNTSASTQPVSLNHASWFDLKERLPESYQQERTKFRGFVAHDSGLYFLIVAKPGNGQEFMIVHTDLNGRLLKRILMPGERESTARRSILEMSVDDNGNCYVLQTIKDSSGRRVEFLVYDRSGNARNTLAVSEIVQTFCLKAESLWYLSDNNELRQMVTSPMPNTRRLEIPQLKNISDVFPKIFPLPGNRIAVLDGVSAQLYVIDQVSSDTQVFSLLQLPEVRRSWESYPTETRGPAAGNGGRVQFARAQIITGLSATPEGDIYLTISGIPFGEGAVVLRIDQQGNLVRSLRCVLPTLETRRSADNPEGYAGSFGLIGTTGSYLFVAGADGDVLSYQR